MAVNWQVLSELNHCGSQRSGLGLTQIPAVPSDLLSLTQPVISALENSYNASSQLGS